MGEDVSTKSHVYPQKYKNILNTYSGEYIATKTAPIITAGTPKTMKHTMQQIPIHVPQILRQTPAKEQSSRPMVEDAKTQMQATMEK